jgi:hypothetical protein
MTGRPADNASPLPHDLREPLGAAEADLEKVRETLGAAARGEATPGAVKEVVTQYLADHHSALQASAAAVGEEIRRQAVEELYRWRAQLNTQLEAVRRAKREPER